ncbi:NAD(P)H-dependent oxidoreductase [Peteryoungia desertarenae]|uniref:NAD(P)H-dependent oxidoreductase n=1 Tax=Peteryoungia desertarenae TaxID=1813451 RepID=A0ABX6QLJ0_9HYPH|nr:NAD(P)H-dependent oxidoreductase [Peteryoungia desertarenae]QLF69127.1 NAD(P)H-dependent oxidoreductase [Peteryoungia desertarenae]
MEARRFLVVLAHPLPESFAASAALTVAEALQAKGHAVDLIDLYAEDFDPRLSPRERAAYMQPGYQPDADVAQLVERLKAADGLILVFPQWWFNLPAMMKGFIDRVFVPGVAFDHDANGGRLIPLLTQIRTFWVVTSTGSPWWIVHLYMGSPVKRILKRGVAAFCAKKLDFRIFSLHDMDRITERKRTAFLATLARFTAKI